MMYACLSQSRRDFYAVMKDKATTYHCNQWASIPFYLIISQPAHALFHSIFQVMNGKLITFTFWFLHNQLPERIFTHIMFLTREISFCHFQISQTDSCKHINRNFLRTNRFLKNHLCPFSHLKLHIATITDTIMEGPQASIGEINPWLPPRTYLIDIHHWENQGLNVSCFTIKTTKKIVW